VTAVAARHGAAAMALAGRCLALLLAANLAREVAQLPLCTLWSEGSADGIARAVLHCMAGDGIVGAASPGGALLLAGTPGWPAQAFARVALATTALGVAATAALEWLNVEPRRNRAFAAAMPRLPPLGTGLSPVLQWILLPPLSLLAARRLARLPGQALGRHP
jgi:hypothetical protein